MDGDALSGRSKSIFKELKSKSPSPVWGFLTWTVYLSVLSGKVHLRFALHMRHVSSTTAM